MVGDNDAINFDGHRFLSILRSLSDIYHCYDNMNLP
jgi:hypothetical protein